jgi:hypothetical protein
MAWVNTEPWTTAPSSPYRPNNPNAWTTNGAQNQTPAPVVAPVVAGGGGGGPQQPVDQFAQAFQGVPWGTFGTYDNWANAYAGQHGQAPNAQAVTDYWDSQAFLARNGRPPSYGEWSDRWWTGDWNGMNPWSTQRLPFRYTGGHNGEGGANTWESGFGAWSPRGEAVSPLYQQAMANPTNLWRSMVPGFTAWQNYLANRQPQMNVGTLGAPAWNAPQPISQPGNVAPAAVYAPPPAALPQPPRLPMIFKTAPVVNPWPTVMGGGVPQMGLKRNAVRPYDWANRPLG